jgi:tetratricopeptide (TPR) repeat protein/tRNA A-37 threonylcarbamoyl transferase component Bud32
MKCPKCDTENPETQRFCGDCGTQLEISVDASIPTKTIEAPKEELTTGSTFAGRYQIIEEIGRGGMGKVYKVLDKEVNAKIALKLIKPEIASDKKVIERFRNELRMARDIAHKNVCRMYDLNKEDSAYFITMEYVDGEDLKGLIRKMGRLSSGQAISIAKQVCDGLIEAHKLGVVHRDLKPQNIMIDRDGNARIMDFGIARSLSAKGITGSGVMIGTPDYMSPEQVEGKETDQRSDIYSLGIILYEMVTGQVPFEGDTPFTIGVKHKSETPKAPKELNAQIPEDLNNVILRCLEKDIENRYLSAGELLSDLINIEKGLPTTEKIVPERKPLTSREITVQFSMKKFLVPVFFVLAIAVIAVVIWQLLPQKVTAPTPLSDKPSLAIMYFKNNTGDENLDHWRTMLADLLIKDLTQSKYVRVLSEDKLLDILENLNQIEAKSYSASILKEVASQGRANHILQGTFSKAGEDIRVDVTLQNAATMEIIGSEGVRGRGEDSIFSMVDELTKKIKTRFKLTNEEIASDIDKSIEKITTSSQEAYNYFREGWKHDDIGDFRKAMQFYEKAIEIDPEFAQAYIYLAVDYYNLRLFSEEKRLLEKAMELTDRVSERERYLIEAMYYSTSEQTFDKAIVAFERILALYPEDEDANGELGWVYQAIEQYDKAAERFEVLVKNKVENITLHLNLAHCYHALNEYEKALNVLESYAEAFPENAMLRQSFAYNYIQQSKLNLAMSEIEKAYLLDPGHYANFMTKGDIYLYMGELTKAEEEYENLLKAREPVGHSWRLSRLANLYLLQGRFEEAKNVTIQGIGLSEKYGQNVWKSLWHLGKAELHITMKNPAQALKEADKAWSAAVEAEYPRGQRSSLSTKAWAYTEMGSIDEAIQEAEKLKEMIEEGLNQKRMRHYFSLMGRIENKRANFPEAIDYSKRALSLTCYGPFTKPASMINELALAYYKSGNLEKAREEFVRITKLTTGRLSYGDIYTRSFYMLGKIHEELDDNNQAIENYEKFLDIWKNADPGLDDVEDAKKRLTILKQ